MTWEIVAGIISLIGVFGLVASWTSKLTKTLTNLEAVLNALKDTLQELRDANGVDHKHFFKHLADHESRIERLEIINKIKGGESQ